MVKSSPLKWRIEWIRSQLAVRYIERKKNYTELDWIRVKSDQRTGAMEEKKAEEQN